MAPRIAPKISPTLRTGVGSTAGAMDGSPEAESGPVAAKRQKTAGGKIPQVSLNLDGARHRANPPRLATAKAAVDMKGPEVIPSDNDDEPVEEATTTKPRKVGRMTPGGKLGLSVGRRPGMPPSYVLGRRLMKRGRSRWQKCPQVSPSRWTTTTSTSSTRRRPGW